MDPENKQRISIYIDKELVKQTDKMLKIAGYVSRNEFVSKAIENYIAELLLQKDSNLVTDKLAVAIGKASELSHSKVANALFRYAVFIDMMVKMMAECFEYTPDELKQMEHDSYNNVRRTKGKISLDEALKHAYIPEQSDKHDSFLY